MEGKAGRAIPQRVARTPDMYGGAGTLESPPRCKRDALGYGGSSPSAPTMKISEKAKWVGEFWSKLGFKTTVLLDKEGEPILTHAWWPELIVTRLDMSKKGEKKRTAP
jgi:hypothetical protein